MVLRGESAPERLALWVVPVADLGGVARHVIDAVRTGIPGWRIVVLCPEGPLAARLRTMGAAVTVGPVSPADGARAATAEVRRVLRALRPEVLHTHLAFADLVGVAAVTGLRSGRGRRVRVVSTEHGISGVRGLYQAGAMQTQVKAAAHRARMLRTDAVIAVSDSTAQQIRAQWAVPGRVMPPVTVVRNGVEHPVGERAGEPGLRFLSLARLAPEKRIDRALEAFALVAAEHPAARLTIAGEGPERGALEKLVQERCLGESVRLVGHVEAGPALAAHDVIVQLSAWENLSYTLLDAVAHGLGVVATDVGGNREIVPGRCLVDGENIGAIADVMMRQGLQTAERPGRERLTGVTGMCAQIAAVYEAVIR
ncbi:glycosyltransferase family 4 protein [Brachybacterium sp. UMB0905]|uniref:glycosyltransferase family 4 protein n=1 Tax=Brachybacterium sp. UMB0905 TaxID=2069310 RepID=UPI000C7F91CA|nr:glycosyltransferase family 4 protein [Brachybacterium sp. UMB0905]PMC74786.1 glycosyl transferase [Brachybacterium sp. UMB0905]